MSDAQLMASLKSLQGCLHDRARELEEAQRAVHSLRLEQRARDRLIQELKATIAELEFQLSSAQAAPD
ncbi:MAG: hypothetical protein JO193_00760 [Candidatus Eremiobacteraeota bacterium]|nr:hypothetical protein [Candidatus Eremiobacteraeota bacterium]